MRKIEKLAIYGGPPTSIITNSKTKRFGQEEIDAVLRVMKNDCISEFRGGHEVKAFEKQFASYIGTSYAIATTSGTSALHTAVASLNLPKGSEVIVPAMTFVSTASVLLQENLIPIFADIDDSFCISTDDLIKKITKNTRAVIPVHLYGHPADMLKINKIAKSHDLYVIEDACQAHGASINGQKVGTFGDMACFSFYETKNMTCGEGGMITTQSRSVYDMARLKREHGSPYTSKTWYCYEVLGYNYNMTNLQAAIGLEQLKKLDDNNRRRIEIANLYRTLLKGLDLTFIRNKDGYCNVSHNFPVLLPLELAPKRDFFVDALKAEGIPVDIAYPFPLYRANIFKELNSPKCLYAENMSSRLFTLFTDGAISQEVVADTAKAIVKILSFLKE